MNMHLINIGFGNLMSTVQIVAIISPSSAPAKRLKDEAKNEGRLIDATQGRRTRSIIVTKHNQIFLSAVQAETLAVRFHNVGETVKPITIITEEKIEK